MKSKEVLKRLACVGAAVVGTSVLGGCGSSNSSLEVTPTAATTPVITTEQVSPYSLKVRYSADWLGKSRTWYDFIITRESPSKLLLSDTFYNNMNPYIIITGLEYSRSRGCDISDTKYVANNTVSFTVADSELCFQELK